MINKEKQALNQKIAKWCGFDSHTNTKEQGGLTCWCDPLTGFWNKPLPNFCDSLDAHNEYTIPKLASLGWLTRVQYGKHTYEGAYSKTELIRTDGKPTGLALLYNTKRVNLCVTHQYEEIADIMAEALSLAIENLIDDGVK